MNQKCFILFILITLLDLCQSSTTSSRPRRLCTSRTRTPQHGASKVLETDGVTTTYRVTCHPGFKVARSDLVTCIRGELIGHPPKCIRLKNVLSNLGKSNKLPQGVDGVTTPRRKRHYPHENRQHESKSFNTIKIKRSKQSQRGGTSKKAKHPNEIIAPGVNSIKLL